MWWKAWGLREAKSALSLESKPVVTLQLQNLSQFMVTTQAGMGDFSQKYFLALPPPPFSPKIMKNVLKLDQIWWFLA